MAHMVHCFPRKCVMPWVHIPEHPSPQKENKEFNTTESVITLKQFYTKFIVYKSFSWLHNLHIAYKHNILFKKYQICKQNGIMNSNIKCDRSI